MKKNLLVCRSGGRTSEYMYKYILENHSDEYNIVGIFANTGWEHHKTLEFVNNNDIENEKLYGVKPIWVEAVVHKGRVACTHKLVTYETASRDREPFVEVVKKYGLPNSAYPHCTRELKEAPIHDYIKNVMGWSNKKGEIPDPHCDCSLCFIEPKPYFTALGIRSDEPVRVMGSENIAILKKSSPLTIKNNADAMDFRALVRESDKITGWELISLHFEKLSLIDNSWPSIKKMKSMYDKFIGLDTPQNKVYPLVDWHPDKPDKLDIIDWWEERDFDLGIPEHLGNCVGCFRKSERKSMKAYRDAPEQFVNTMEKDYGHIGSNKIKGVHVDEPRTMYRNYKTCDDIITMFNEVDKGWLNKDDPDYMNEGCASSCEPFAG